MSKNIIIALLILFFCHIIHDGAISCAFAEEKNICKNSLFNEKFWRSNPNSIWNRLQNEPIKQLEHVNTSQDRARVEWIKVAVIGKRYSNDIKELSRHLIAWRNAHPNHPANAFFPTNSSLENLTINKKIPNHIALLLPNEGNMKANGEAIRNGFLSGYYEALSKNYIKQTITFYDTNSHSNMTALYQQAISEGADMIVGPLTKENVQSLLRANKFDVPILALNYTEGVLPNNFYEFGLSPFDETQQIAEKAWQDRHTRAIVIASQDPWGMRISQSLVSHWQNLGGKITDTLYFKSQTDFTFAIAKLLHVDPILDRQKMKKQNNKSILEKQRRQDFDVIFLLTRAQDARSIVPTLKYYYASKIPIYATSAVYSGIPDPQKDIDLNGVTFPDIPWLLKKKSNKESTNRLFAVGRDAYLISNDLQRFTELPKFQIYAATGALSLNSQNQIYRRLPWTTIQHGHV